MGSRVLVVVEGRLVSLEPLNGGGRQLEKLHEATGTLDNPPGSVDSPDWADVDLLDVLERFPPDPADGYVRRTLWRLSP